MNSEPHANRLMAVVALWIALVAGFFLGLFFFVDGESAFPLQLVYFALLLVAVSRWTGAILLLALQIQLFLTEPGGQSSVSGPAPILFVIVTVVMLISLGRFHTLQFAQRHSLYRLIRNVWSFLSGPDVQHSTRSARAVWDAFLPMALGLALRLMMAVLLVTGAFLLMRFADVSDNIRDWAVRVNAGDRQARPTPMTLVMALAVLLLLSEIAWRQKSVIQARMYLRSILVQDLYSELSMIVQQRLKLRRLEQNKARAENRKG